MTRHTLYPPPIQLHQYSASWKEKKNILDAWNGYHSIPLSTEACDTTRFITEWSRYQYLQALQRLLSIQQWLHKTIWWYYRRFPLHSACVDDSILWDDVMLSFWHTIRYIRLCDNNGIILNPDKFQFTKDNVEFPSFDISSTGYRPTQKLLEGIR